MPSYGSFVTGPLATAGGMGTRIGVAFVSLTTDNAGLAKGFTQAEVMGKQFGERFGTTMGSALAAKGASMQRVGATLTKSLTIPIVAALGAATKLSVDFRTAMERVSALALIPQKNIAGLSDRVLQLSSDTGQSATDLANSLYFVASAGLKTSQVFPVLAASAKSAQIGMASADTTSTLLVNTLNAFGKTAPTVKAAMDVLTVAVQRGVASPEELASSLGTVIPVAAQMGISFDQVAGAVAAATNQGISAARAATGLRYMMISLEAPTQVAMDALKTYGLTAGDVARSLSQQGLLPTLKMLADTFDLTSVKGRQAFFHVLGGVRAGHIALSLVGKDYQQVNTIMDATAKAAAGVGDAFDAARKKMLATPGVQITKAWNELKVAGIKLGDQVSPYVEDLATGIGKLADAFAGLPSPIQHTTALLLAFVAAAGPALAIFGTGFRLLGTGIGAFGGAANNAMMAWQSGTWERQAVSQYRYQAGSPMLGLAQNFRPGIRAGSFGGLSQPIAPEFTPASAMSSARAFVNSPLIGGMIQIGSLLLAGKAINDLVKYMHVGETEAQTWSHQLETGKITVDQLNKAVTDVTSTAHSSIPIIGGWIQSMSNSKVIGAAAAAIDAYNRAVRTAIEQHTKYGPLSPYFPTISTPEVPGTVAQKQDFTKLSGRLESLGIKQGPVQQALINAALGSGNYGLAIDTLGRAIKNRLIAQLEPLSNSWAKVALKQLQAAHSGKQVLDVFHSIDNYLTHLNRTRGARSLGNPLGDPAAITNPYVHAVSGIYHQGIVDIYGQNGQNPNEATIDPRYTQVFNMLARSATLNKTNASRLGNELAALMKSQGYIPDSVMAAVKNAKKTGNIDKAMQLIRGYLKDSAKSDALTEADKRILDSVTSNIKAREAILAATGGGITPGLVSGQTLTKLGARIDQLYGAGGKLKKHQEIQIRFLLAEGKINQAMRLVQRLTKEAKSIALGVTTSQAQHQIDAFRHAMESHPINLSVYTHFGRYPTSHSGGFIGRMHSGGTMQDDEQMRILQLGEFVVRRSAAQRNAQLLQYINRTGHAPRGGDVHIVNAGAEDIVNAIRQMGHGGHGDVYLDGQKVGTVMNRRRKMRADL